MKEFDIASLRTINQQLAEPQRTTIDDMLGWFGAIQAQEYAQSKWALGLRLPTVLDSDIEHAFNKGEIIRTHILRPTWHFVRAKDLRWMIQLSGPRVEQYNKSMYKKMELSDTLLNKSTDIIARKLEGGNYLTRTELNDALAQKNISADGIRLGCIMMHAELTGVICSGPRIGKQFTYALLDERVKNTAAISREEALAKLTQCYFSSRGPATIKDFSTWSGLTISDCTKGIQSNKHVFTQHTINNEVYYSTELKLKTHAESNKIFLLPIYDEYIMGYKNRAAILEFKNKHSPDMPFVFDNMLVYQGQIIGTWKRKINNKYIDMEYFFFAKPSKLQLEYLNIAVERYESFHQLPVHLIK